MDSLMAVEAYKQLQGAIGEEIILPETLLFDYPNLAGLSAFIYQTLSDTKPSQQVSYLKQYETESIAIVGMGCCFPGGANDPDAFWSQLIKGVDTVTEVPEERWSLDSYYAEERGTPGKQHPMPTIAIDSVSYCFK